MKSLRLFVGRSMLTYIPIFPILGLLSVLAAFYVNDMGNSFLCLLGEVFCIMQILYIMRLIFNTNIKSAAGYRFFHSLPNSAAMFRNAVITANVFLIAYSVVFTLVESLLFREFAAMFAAFALFILGWINLFGNISNLMASVIPIFVIGFAYGFLDGFFEDEGKPAEVYLAVFAAAAVFCVFGVLYSVLRAKKRWERNK